MWQFFTFANAEIVHFVKRPVAVADLLDFITDSLTLNTFALIQSFDAKYLMQNKKALLWNKAFEHVIYCDPNEIRTRPASLKGK